MQLPRDRQVPAEPCTRQHRKPAHTETRVHRTSFPITPAGEPRGPRPAGRSTDAWRGERQTERSRPIGKGLAPRAGARWFPWRTRGVMPAPWVRGAVLACAEAGGEPRCVPDFATARWDGCFSPGHWERSRRAAGRLRVWSPLTALRRPSLPRLAAEAFLLWRPASAAEVRSGAWEPSEGRGFPAPPPAVEAENTPAVGQALTLPFKGHFCLSQFLKFKRK